MAWAEVADSASLDAQVVTIALFIAHGDTWDLVALRNIFLVGMGLELFAGLAMFGFRDDCALEPAASALTSTAAGSSGTSYLSEWHDA